MRWGVALVLFASEILAQRRPNSNRYNGPPCNPRYYNCNYAPPLGGYPQGPNRIVVSQPAPPITTTVTTSSASYQSYLASLQNPAPLQYSPVTSSSAQYPAAAGQYPPFTSNPLYDVVPAASSTSTFGVTGSSQIAQYDPRASSSTTAITTPGAPGSSVISVTVYPPVLASGSTGGANAPPASSGVRSPNPVIPSPTPVVTSPVIRTPFVSPTLPPTIPPTPPPTAVFRYSTEATPRAVYVQCGTTKGPFTLRVEPDWAPLGASRFLAMVDRGFFNDIAFFRVVPNFLVQFGLASSPDLQAQWADQIPDDPHQPIPFSKGMLSFAGSGPNTRSTQLFIALQDSRSLGTQPWETPFAQVENMSVVDSIYSGYGEMQAFGGRGPDSSQIAQYGNAVLRQQYPLLDYILFCQRMPRPAPTTPPTIPPTRPPTRPPTFPVIIEPQTLPPTVFTFPPTVPPTFPAILAPTGKAPTGKAGKGKGKGAEVDPIIPLPPSPMFFTVPLPSPTPVTLPKCKNTTCGSAISSDPITQAILCSCHQDCVKDDSCCLEFSTACPALAAIAHSTSYPSCTKETCGRVLYSGTTELCSCHENCMNKRNCCPLFAMICPDNYARASGQPLALPPTAVTLTSPPTAPPTAAPPTSDIMLAPSGLPRCTPRDCTFAFMNGDKMLCSCTTGCEEAKNCCPDFQAVCANAATSPTCTIDVCGAEFRTKNSTEVLCSCHSSCVPANTCCTRMAEACPEELAAARHAAATALLAGPPASSPTARSPTPPTPPTPPVSPPATPKADRPKCDNTTCGADFANDETGTDVICSCYFQCVDDNNCCENFQAGCPDEYARATKTTMSPSPAGGKGKGKGGKGKGKGANQGDEP